jgi:hypothetical protein
MKLNKSLDSIALGGKTYREIFIGGQLYNLNNVSYTSPNPIFLGNGVWEIQGNSNFDNGQLRLIMSDTSKYLDGTYYFRVDTKNTSNTNVVLSRGFDIFSLNAWVTNFLTTNANSVNSFSQNFNYVRANTTPSDRNRILLTTNAQTNNIQISPYFINLTALFGAGNEPTKAQMDTLFAEFQEAGSVAVGQFEQGQGKNLFDGRLEQGNISVIDGQNLISTTRLRTTEYINVLDSISYYLSIKTPSQNSKTIEIFYIFYYDVNKNFISTQVKSSSNVPLTFPSGTNYIRWLVRYTDNATITPTDLTNPNLQLELGSVATTYEPYSYLAIHNPASNDIPIPALNNKTLNEVFVGGQLVANGTFDQVSPIRFDNAAYGGAGFGVVNGVYKGVVSSLDVAARIVNDTNISFLNGNVYYVRGEILPKYNTTTFLQFRENTTVRNSIQFNPTPNIWNKVSVLLTPTLNFTGRFWFVHQTNTQYALGDEVLFDNINLINLTSLGIASQTQAQMDAYFEAWQRNNAGTLLANTFIQHDQNSVPIADLNGKTLDEVFDRSILTDITALPNGVKYYEVSGGNVVQRVQERVLLSSDISSIFTGLTNVNQVRIDLLNALSVSGNTITGTVYFKGLTEISKLNRDNVASIETFFTENQYIDYLVSKSTYTTLAQAQTALTGTQILYQLATPITIVSGVSITQAQLDFWYSVWQQNHKLGMRVHRASGNDIPLAVLNNQSLNQVFVGGQLVTGFTSNGFTGTITNNNGIITHTITNVQSFAGVVLTRSANLLNNAYYLTYEMLPFRNHTAQYYLGNSYYNANSVIANQWNYVSITRNATATNNLVILSDNGGLTTNMVIGSQTSYRNVNLINLTSLGIATLTKSQLDYLYQVWQFNQVNALVARQFIQEA